MMMDFWSHDSIIAMIFYHSSLLLFYIFLGQCFFFQSLLGEGIKKSVVKGINGFATKIMMIFFR